MSIRSMLPNREETCHIPLPGPEHSSFFIETNSLSCLYSATTLEQVRNSRTTTYWSFPSREVQGRGRNKGKGKVGGFGPTRRLLLLF